MCERCRGFHLKLNIADRDAPLATNAPDLESDPDFVQRDQFRIQGLP
jgi:hypothetical protein